MPMRCDESQDHLVALLHHELSAADETNLQAHLKDCAACREELEHARAVIQSMRHLVPVEPAAVARQELEQSIALALERKLLEGNQPRPGGSSHKLLLAPPQQPLLGMEPQKYLPPPSGPQESSRGNKTSKHGIVALSPSARAVSARIQARSRGQMSSPYLWWGAIALVVLVGSFSAALYLPFFASKKPDAETKAQRLDERRRDERRLARRHSKDSFLKKYQAPLGEDVPDGAAYRVVPHHVPSTGETCLVLYPEDAAAAAKTPSASWALEELLKSGQRVTVSEGRCILPAALVDKYIGLEVLATVLQLDNRIEVWPAATLNEYLRCPPQSAPPVDETAVRGLVEE